MEKRVKPWILCDGRLKDYQAMISHVWSFLDELEKDGEVGRGYTPAPGNIGMVSGNRVHWHKSLLLFNQIHFLNDGII